MTIRTIAALLLLTLTACKTESKPATPAESAKPIEGTAPAPEAPVTPVTPAEAEAAARAWLTALAEEDLDALARRSAYPVWADVDFQDVTTCAWTDVKVMEACLSAGSHLNSALDYGIATLTVRSVSAVDAAKRLRSPERVSIHEPARLEADRSRLADLDRNGDLLVDATFKGVDGENSVLVAVRPAQGGPAISAVFAYSITVHDSGD